MLTRHVYDCLMAAVTPVILEQSSAPNIIELDLWKRLNNRINTLLCSQNCVTCQMVQLLKYALEFREIVKVLND